MVTAVRNGGARFTLVALLIKSALFKIKILVKGADYRKGRTSRASFLLNCEGRSFL